MKNALALVAPLALAGCTVIPQPPPAETPVPADGIARAAIGQRVYVDGPYVTPLAVLEDSRCPMNARCVWAGRVRVKMVWIRGNGEKQPFEVTLGEPTQLADGQFTLESVRPEKRTDIKLKPSDYRFSFRFAGGL